LSGASYGDPVDRFGMIARGLGILVILGGLCLGVLTGLVWWQAGWSSPPVALLGWSGGFVLVGILVLVFDRLARRFL